MQQNLWNGLLACTLFLCLTSPPAQAQETKKDSITRYKWEIGTDLLWLIDKNSAPRNSVFIRRNFTTQSGKLRAWRLRVSGEFASNDLQDGRDTSDHLKDWSYSLLLRPGYEWQKQYGKFQFNYGIDAHFRWQKTRYDHFYDRVNNLGQNDDAVATGYTQTWQWGVVPFLGAKYFINHRWAISGEASLTTYYQHFNRLQNSISLLNPNSGFGKTDTKTWVVQLNPLYVLQLSYFFN